MPNRITNRITIGTIGIHATFILLCMLCLIPFLLVVSISFSSETDVYQYGYRLIPKVFDLTAYKLVFQNPTQILNSYKVTIFVTICGTIFGVLIMSMIAYIISRDNFKFKKEVTFYVFFTMLFSGGLVPFYILITQYLKLTDTIWVLIIPYLVNPFHVILLRSFFIKIPNSIAESAKIDGASEFRILFQIIMPLSKPALATIAFLTAMIRWNDWFPALLYIRKDALMPLQYLLQKLLSDLTFLSQNSEIVSSGLIGNISIPTETMRMAMLVVAAGPMLLVFPFFQKYFVKGLTVGSIKG